MPSTFQGDAIFNSGPHRFSVGLAGAHVVPGPVLDPLEPKSTISGLRETVITIRGRLIASDEAGLWQARDAIAARLTDPPQVGDLVDHHGREWKDVTFTAFTAADRTDRGRTWSIAYEATFIAIAGM